MKLYFDISYELFKRIETPSFLKIIRIEWKKEIIRKNHHCAVNGSFCYQARPFYSFFKTVLFFSTLISFSCFIFWNPYKIFRFYFDILNYYETTIIRFATKNPKFVKKYFERNILFDFNFSTPWLYLHFSFENYFLNLFFLIDLETFCNTF